MVTSSDNKDRAYQAGQRVTSFITPRNVALAGVAVAAVLLHRRRVNLIVKGMTLAYNDGVQEAFDNGVRYGVQLVKDTGLVAAAEALTS